MMPNDLGTAPNGYDWELDLRSNGSGWCGTFANIVRTAVQDITENGQDNGRDWFVEVTLADGTVLQGNIAGWLGDDTFTVADGLPIIVEVDDVVRFRA